MTIKTRIEKLEQRHSPQEETLIGIYFVGDDFVTCNGERFTLEAWAALAPAHEQTEIKLNWGDEDLPLVLIPDNGRS